MNVLFLIGNGFDLNVGLKTRFSDFLQVYVRTHSSDIRMASFIEAIKTNFDTWADFEKQLGQHAKLYDSNTKDDLIFCRDDFLTKLADYLQDQEERIDYSGEHVVSEIVRVFKHSIGGFQKGLPPESRHVIDSVYARHMSQQHTYNFISFNYTRVFDKCISILCKGEAPIIKHSKPGGVVSDFVKEEILHIHGTVDEDVIIGVDNTSQIANTALSADKKFTRRILKPVINDELRNMKNGEGDKLISQSEIICVFGMSIGETDKTWWKRIGQWLYTKSSAQLVLFIYEEPYNKRHATLTIEIVYKWIDRFFDLWGIPNDRRESLRSRIHIGLNTDLFKVDLTQSTNRPGQIA
ncbi:MAG: bacteriophage abortive infection AbiH family protein [Clostridia bacterium]|nr:bacteriophage abortive infection AbiH family protein [Clostridia bacterium]